MCIILTQIPALNDLTTAQDKLKFLTSISTAVEYTSILQSADIMHCIINKQISNVILKDIDSDLNNFNSYLSHLNRSPVSPSQSPP